MKEISFDSKMYVKAVSVSVPIVYGEILPTATFDLLVSNAARVSVDGFTAEFTSRDAGLLRRLITDVHGSPFEHAVLGFQVEVPIFVERQWRTHRWSSFNEMSGRYSEMLPKGYVPDVLHKQIGTAMDYRRESLEFTILDLSNIEAMYTESWKTYQTLLYNGVANEEARIILPVGMYTKFYWTANLRSIANFLSLRTDVHAQLQIREAAAQVEDIFRQYFPHIHDAWNEAGRKPLGA